MKLLKLFLFILTAFVFASCGKHSDGTSVWAGGLWLAPLLTGIGTVVFGLLTLTSSTSGTVGKKGNTFNVGYGIFTVCLLIATIVIIWMVNADK